MAGHLFRPLSLFAMAARSSSKKRSRRKRKRKRERKPNPATRLTDDLLVEILSRVPYRSLCRFRCVSKGWRALISGPDYRTRLPQTLAGFFHIFNADWSLRATPVDYSFTNVSGTGVPLIDPSFPFLPDRDREHLDLVDCCNGLLLFRCFRYGDGLLFDYLVVNPATEKWVTVPVSCRNAMVRLGFDLAFSSHFYIFELQYMDDDDRYEDVDKDPSVLGVKIYSSETGVWCYKDNGWGYMISARCDFKSVFVNGVLYVIALDDRVIGAVDVKGETWRIIHFPRTKHSPFYCTSPGFIDLSQGRLHFATDDHTERNLVIWVLGDKDTNKWTSEHKVCFKHLVGTKHVEFGNEFIVVAIHPDRNMVFFVSGRDEKTLMSYDMDSGSVHVIRNLGHINSSHHFLPYVPLFSKSLPDAEEL